MFRGLVAQQLRREAALPEGGNSLVELAKAPEQKNLSSTEDLAEASALVAMMVSDKVLAKVNERVVDFVDDNNNADWIRCCIGFVDFVALIFLLLDRISPFWKWIIGVSGAVVTIGTCWLLSRSNEDEEMA